MPRGRSCGGRRRAAAAILVFGLTLAGVPPAMAAEPASEAGAQPPAVDAELAAVERAFAQTMADRDFAAFARFIADDAVFFGSGDRPLRGKAAVLAAWQRFFAPGTPAPFAWAPDVAAVLPSGGLGLTSGPVTGSDGKALGRFQSTWRREPDGHWRIVLDRGN